MKKIAIYGLSGLIALTLVGSAAAKFVGPAPVIEQFTKFGLADWMRPIGVLELICVTVYFIPRTLLLGTLLLSAFLGGAMVAHLSHAEPPFVPAVVLGLVWLLAYLKKPSLFA